MAIGTAALVGIAGATAAAGAIAGASDKKSTSSTNTDMNNTSTSSVDAGSANANEQAATSAIGSNFSSLQGLINLGPGAQDVTNSTGASRDLATLLQQYQQTGGAPSG